MQPVIQMTARQAVAAGVKCLMHGPSGVGKTMIATTAPKPFLISAESGLLSLTRANIERVFGADRPDITYDVPFTTIDTLDDLVRVYDWFANDKQSAYFESIILDSLSEIAEKVLTNELKRVKDPRAAYGEMATHLIHTVKLFRDLPNRHVFMIAKQGRIADQNNVTKLGPLMPGKQVEQQLPYLFDEVFAMLIVTDPQGKQHRVLQTQPDMQIDAKDRSGALAPLEAPHLTHIIRKISGV